MAPLYNSFGSSNLKHVVFAPYLIVSNEEELFLGDWWIPCEALGHGALLDAVCRQDFQAVLSNSLQIVLNL